MKKNFAFIYAVAVMIPFSLYVGCKKSSSAASQPIQGAPAVSIQNMAFNPATLTVPVNTTVKWTNMDGYTHTVTSDSGLFNSTINSGGTFSYRFTAAGTYPYHCTIHPMMIAKVIVH